MTAAELLKIWAESCKETDDCEQCFFEEICPIYEHGALTYKTKSFINRADEKFGRAGEHFHATKMMREDNHSIGIMLDEGAKMPTRAHDADAGYDLYRKLDGLKNMIIAPRSSEIFDTGVHIAIPRGFVGFIKSKSGLNVNHGLLSDGVIDSGYTGSIRVKLYNRGDEAYIVHPGDKISQLVILPIITPRLEIVDSLGETERGNKGFGSSGR